MKAPIKESDRQDGKAARCPECRHHYITHEPAHPYGCRAMGFKSREAPFMVVLRDSGTPCMRFESKTARTP